MVKPRTIMTRLALGLALLLSLEACSVGRSDGSGFTFATPLAETVRSPEGGPEH